MTRTTISHLNHRAQGISDTNETFDRVLPGEILSYEDPTSFRIEEPSDERVKPVCPHYKSCGGCNIQHASEKFVAAWKTDVVRQGLSAHGLNAEMLDIITSPAKSRRRAKFSGRRTKKGALVGFHAKASDVVLDVPNCTLLEPELTAAIPTLYELVTLGASRKGEIAITVTNTDTGLDVSVTKAKDLTGELRLHLAAVVQKGKFARLVWNGDLVAMERPPVQSFGSAKVCVPAGAFLQATQHGELALLQAVQSIAKNAKSILDLFSGSGTFSLPLAEKAEVHAVESEAEMLAALDQGWRMAKGVKKVTTETRDLFRRPLYPDELKRFDTAVIDPPRAGALAQVEQIAVSDLKTVAYVSCNPVTFARDAKVLCDAGFDLNWVRPVDQFRWSSHVELIGEFTRT